MKTIKQIRTAIRKGLRHKMTLEAICVELGITNDRGEPNPGLAHNIVFGRNGKDYEPTEFAVRRRLGMKEICPVCKRAMPKDKALKPAPATLEDFEMWWNSLLPREKKRYKQWCFTEQVFA